MQSEVRLDAIYVAASARDARFTRICVASIRHFYPDAPIRLLVGGTLESGLAEELEEHWQIRPADVRAGQWGWGFVKLEPLFGPPGERFMVVDSDTAFVGPVLSHWAECQGDFLVDEEQLGEVDTHRLYYDWQEVSAIDPAALPPQFVFNSGQWFGTAGLLKRQDFSAFIDWSSLPPKLHHPSLFKNGEQGVINYVFNQRAQLDGLRVERRKLMHWPGHGTAGIGTGSTTTPLVVHWAGFKGARLADLPWAALLRRFEAEYYALLPCGSFKRVWRRFFYPVQFHIRKLNDQVSHRIAIWRGSGTV